MYNVRQPLDSRESAGVGAIDMPRGRGVNSSSVIRWAPSLGLHRNGIRRHLRVTTYHLKTVVVRPSKACESVLKQCRFIPHEHQCAQILKKSMPKLEKRSRVQICTVEKNWSKILIVWKEANSCWNRTNWSRFCRTFPSINVINLFCGCSVKSSKSSSGSFHDSSLHSHWSSYFSFVRVIEHCF